MIFFLDLLHSHDKTHLRDELKQIMDRKIIDCLKLDRNAYNNLITLLHLKGDVLNISECKYVARLCGVQESDLTTLLKKIHDKLGLILHFHQVRKMKNLVICESNYLIDPLESLTAISLSGTPKCPQDRSTLCKTGEISLSLIDDIKSCEEHDDKVTISCLLELLKYYRFLSEAEGANGMVSAWYGIWYGMVFAWYMFYVTHAEYCSTHASNYRVHCYVYTNISSQVLIAIFISL